MSEVKRPYRRRILLVNPAFQGRFMVWMGALAVGVVTVMQAAHMYFFYRLRQHGLESGLPPEHLFFQFLTDAEAKLAVVTVASFGVVLLLAGGVGLVLSHKIAGPMYRLRAHFEENANTLLPRRLTFRAGDYFQEIPEAYNQQVSVAHRRASQVMERLGERPAA